MGSLANQPNRNYLFVEQKDLNVKLDYLKRLAQANEVSLEAMIEVAKICELERQNNLYVQNGDAFDEQMAGIGEHLKQLDDNVRSVWEAIDSQ